VFGSGSAVPPETSAEPRDPYCYRISYTPLGVFPGPFRGPNACLMLALVPVVRLCSAESFAVPPKGVLQNFVAKLGGNFLRPPRFCKSLRFLFLGASLQTSVGILFKDLFVGILFKVYQVYLMF